MPKTLKQWYPSLLRHWNSDTLLIPHDPSPTLGYITAFVSQTPPELHTGITSMMRYLHMYLHTSTVAVDPRCFCWLVCQLHSYFLHSFLILHTHWWKRNRRSTKIFILCNWCTTQYWPPRDRIIAICLHACISQLNVCICLISLVWKNYNKKWQLLTIHK